MFLVNKRVGFLSRAWRLASRWHGPAACERTPLTTPCWSPSRTSRTRWESCAPAPRRAHRDPGRLEVRARRFAAHARRILDAPQRPSETAQRHHLLLLLVAQDVGHPARGHASRHRQRLESSAPLAGFQPSITGRFCPSTEALRPRPAGAACSEHSTHSCSALAGAGARNSDHLGVERAWVVPGARGCP